MTPHVPDPNAHAEASRQTKAWKLAVAIDATCPNLVEGVVEHPSSLYAMPEGWWKDIAAIAKCNPPHSIDTIHIVLENLQHRVNAKRSADALFDRFEREDANDPASARPIPVGGDQ